MKPERRDHLTGENQCVMCNGPMEQKYVPMEQWNIKGSLCGRCYSKKIAEHYPGSHKRISADE